MLVPLKEIIKEKAKNQTAVGAFNTFNLEFTQGIVRGAKAADLPVIIQTTENAIKYAGLKTLYFLMELTIEAESGNTPVAVHLDHGKSLETIKQAIEIGYSSVHIDASEYAFEENIRITKEVAEFGHAKGVFVQGELGNILGREGVFRMQQGQGISKLMTNPEQIKEFVKKTGIDTVAVSLGNLHGHFVGQENIDFERLKKIKEQIDIPIVLHGGSGIPDEQIKEAVKEGVRIVNVDTDLRIAFSEALKEKLKADAEEVDPRKLLKPSINKISEVVEQKLKLFNLKP